MTTAVDNATPVARTPVGNDRSIANLVLTRLGRPKDLFRVQVHRLWGKNYRVNVYRELERSLSLPRIEMTDSFFVTADNEALISQPVIERKY